VVPQFEPHEEKPDDWFSGAAPLQFSRIWSLLFDGIVEATKRVPHDVMGFNQRRNHDSFVRTLRKLKPSSKFWKRMVWKRGKEWPSRVYECGELRPNAVRQISFWNSSMDFPIGSNDMTQLTLGLTRDSAQIAAALNERDQRYWPCWKWRLCLSTKLISMSVFVARSSDHPDLAEWLLQAWISKHFFKSRYCCQYWQALANVKMPGSVYLQSLLCEAIFLSNKTEMNAM